MGLGEDIMIRGLTRRITRRQEMFAGALVVAIAMLILNHLLSQRFWFLTSGGTVVGLEFRIGSAVRSRL
jgi:hypothetical protein